MRVLLIGAEEQLGTDPQKVLLGEDVVALNRGDLDTCDFERTRAVVSKTKTDVVINAAAFNRVDDCENLPEPAFAVNAYGPRNLAQACADLDCGLTHISTDYVFGGEKRTPYTEDDAPNPLSAYGVSKLAGEYFVKNICPRHLIVRTSGLYGTAGSRSKGGNFVETMIRLAGDNRPIRVVNDQVLTPTYTKDLAQAVKELLQAGVIGTYHVTNSGQCSWYEFASEIFGFLRLQPDFSSTTTRAFGSRARRPAYSVLENDRLNRAGVRCLAPWQDALSRYLGERAYLERHDLEGRPHQ